jgi:hypothetical protein
MSNGNLLVADSGDGYEFLRHAERYYPAPSRRDSSTISGIQHCNDRGSADIQEI